MDNVVKKRKEGKKKLAQFIPFEIITHTFYLKALMHMNRQTVIKEGRREGVKIWRIENYNN